MCGLKQGSVPCSAIFLDQQKIAWHHFKEAHDEASNPWLVIWPLDLTDFT